MSTYTPIASVTLSATTSSVTFGGIPQDYADLVLVSNLKGTTSAAYLYIRLNGDSGSNYSYTFMYGNGTDAGSGEEFNKTFIYGTGFGAMLNSANNTPVLTTQHFLSYANTSTFKTVLGHDGLASVGTEFWSHLWRNTSAITSIECSSSTGSFAAGSTFSIYGISSSNAVAPKATGGNTVISDGTYWYHAFKSSGTFTPNQSITADVMIIAGGGGGGWSQTGGGGAGGLSALSSQALTAQDYSVIIGAGGAGAYANAQTVAGNNSSFGAFTAAIGGGKGGNNQNGNVGGNGGCGGGAQGANGTKAGGTGSQGFNGGSGSSNETTYRSTGGGGGLGAAGADGGGTQVGGAGGNGTTSYSSWGLATGTGQNSSGTVYFGGGGGGGQGPGSTPGAAGLGGGGAGSNSGTSPGNSGSANTGGGAGSGGTVGGSGGSGIVIVRYAV